jgi:hypothetical protein
MTGVREVDAQEITRAVRELCVEINYLLPEALRRADGDR